MEKVFESYAGYDAQFYTQEFHLESEILKCLIFNREHTYTLYFTSGGAVCMAGLGGCEPRTLNARIFTAKPSGMAGFVVQATSTMLTNCSQFLIDHKHSRGSKLIQFGSGSGRNILLTRIPDLTLTEKLNNIVLSFFKYLKPSFLV